MVTLLAVMSSDGPDAATKKRVCGEKNPSQQIILRLFFPQTSQLMNESSEATDNAR